MNYNHLTDTEFLNLLDTEGSSDPIVLRLLKVIGNSAATEAINELIQRGMNKDTWEMNYEGLDVSPAEYIRKLENDLDFQSRENSDLEYKLEEAQTRIKQLETRSIAKLIKELHDELASADNKVALYSNKVKTAKASEALAKEKLDMWAILNR